MSVQEEALSQKDHTEEVKGPLHNSSSPRDKEPRAKEWEKVQKWQEARIERRLRGEYESAVLHLQEVLDGNLKTPVSIANLRVENAKSTRKSFLGFLLDPILSSTPTDESNLESVLHTTRKAADILVKTGLFASVSAEIKRSPDPLSPPNSVDVILKTKERGRYTVQSATELGNNEGSANASATVRNVFGGAETLNVNVALGTKTRRSGGATLSAPLTRDLETFGSLNVYGLERDLTAYASCFEGLRGLKASVKGHAPGGKGLHEMGYEAVYRHIRDLTPTASLSIRTAAGETFKSSIFHSFIYDTRDDKLAAAQGAYTKLYHEFAGLGGDAYFYKAEAEAQGSRKLNETVSWSVAGRVGLAWGLKGKEVGFSDRFQLGGPTSVRSFKVNGLGPHDGADSVGGDIYYSLGASVISKVPKKPHWPVNLHGWVNAGRLDQLNKARPLVDNVKDVLSKPSISAGVGLIYRFDPVRVEVNFGVPILSSKSDGTRKGIQVGVGLEFL